MRTLSPAPEIAKSSKSSTSPARKFVIDIDNINEELLLYTSLYTYILLLF